MLKIRPGALADLEAMQDLFVYTIRAVCSKDYTPPQIEMWTASVQNKARWADKIRSQYLLISEINSTMVGFASLDKIDYFDLLYVHADYQSQGIATQLANQIELEAKRQGAKKIKSDVSKTAYGFFVKRGYKLISENQLSILHVPITNFKMTKELNSI